jgi:hypothetical protein
VGSPSEHKDVAWSPLYAAAAASEIARCATASAYAIQGLGLVATDILPHTTRAVASLARL